MLKLNLDPTFKAEVKVTVPGAPEPGTLPLTFKYLTRKEYTEWLETFREEKDSKGKVVKEGKNPTDIFLEYVLGWGLKEEFNRENVEIFLDNYSASHMEIIGQYSKLLFESRIKN